VRVSLRRLVNRCGTVKGIKMAEPHATTAGLIAGAGIGLTGTVMGAQVDALMMGMIAAVFVSIWMPSINDRIRAASAVAISSLLAGYGSPVLAGWLIAEQHGFSGGTELRMLLAVLIGAVCPALMPSAIERARSMILGAGK
jgi:hypothetical protein